MPSTQRQQFEPVILEIRFGGTWFGNRRGVPAQRADQIDGDLYSALLPIAKQFAEKKSPLAATLIYRALADSILARGATKNYKIAVGDIKRAAKLVDSITDWQGHPDHAAYLESLRFSPRPQVRLLEQNQVIFAVGSEFGR